MNKSFGTPSSKLKGKNATEIDVNQPWELDNQAWWDWYVTLAEKDTKTINDTKSLRNFKSNKISLRFIIRLKTSKIQNYIYFIHKIRRNFNFNN